MRQHQVVARLGILSPQLGDFLTGGFDLVRAPTGLAAQVLLVGLLDARRADVVVGAVALLRELVDLVGRDRRPCSR